MILALYWPKQLTYPIERWPDMHRLSLPEQRDTFFESILEEGNVTAACKKLRLARGTVYKYATQNPDFKAQFDTVCDYLYHCLRDDAVRLADEGYNSVNDPLKAALLRLKVEARLRVAGLHKPQSFQVNVDNRQLHVGDVSDPERARLIEMRNRALQNNESNNQLKEK